MPRGDLKHLDALIADLGEAHTGTQSQGPRGLLLEHLEAARRDLLGSMGGEYRASLEFAVDSVVCITDKRVRAETKTILQGLLDRKYGSSDQRSRACKLPRQSPDN